MRTDISDFLAHWTKGDSDLEAAEILLQIIFDDGIRGGTGFIKGMYTCVCFTESPLNVFHSKVGKYRPFGVEMSKKDIFRLGGRPVIYQTDSEYDLLPESIRWRHVGYDPIQEDRYQDFTWEREWRVWAEWVPLEYRYEHDTRIIVPNNGWREWLYQQWDMKENAKCASEAQALGSSYPMHPPEYFPYQIHVLQD